LGRKLSLSEAQGGDVGLSTVVQLDASHECARKEVPRQQMAAADLAPLPKAPLVLVVLADLVFSLGHLDRLGLPERECVDRARGSAPTRGAMAVASALRIACDDNGDSTAEALPFEGLFILAHEFSLRSRSRRDIAPTRYLAKAPLSL
jgi:hypothetical protein